MNNMAITMVKQTFLGQNNKKCDQVKTISNKNK